MDEFLTSWTFFAICAVALVLLIAGTVAVVVFVAVMASRQTAARPRLPDSEGYRERLKPVEDTRVTGDGSQITEN
jgi:hypothetical protein